jgi:hypothetical protein
MSLLIKGGIGKLSEIEIDIDKDWGNYLIRNLGAAVYNSDALRKAQAILQSVMTTKGDILSRDTVEANRLPPNAGKGYNFLRSRGPGLMPVWEDIESLIQYMTASINRAVAFDLPIAEPGISLAIAEDHSGGGFTSNPALVIPATGIGLAIAEDHSGGGFTSEKELSISAPTLGRDATCVYERYQTGDDASLSVYEANWEAQTFTPGIAHNINRVHIKVRRDGSPGTVTVSIRPTTANLPSGADLTNGTLNANVLPTDKDIWVIVSLASYALSAGTRYAIVVRAPDGDASNYLAWRADVTSPTYANGARCYSANNGASWAEDATRDYIFEEGFGN